MTAVDALARIHEFSPADLRRLGHRHLGARGSEKLPEVIRLANPLSGSPMETRIRLALVFGGLPAPVLQHPVGPYDLDLAYPALHLGLEYDGREHLTHERARRDLERQDFLTAAGWQRIIRFPPRDGAAPPGHRGRGRPSPPVPGGTCARHATEPAAVHDQRSTRAAGWYRHRMNDVTRVTRTPKAS